MAGSSKGSQLMASADVDVVDLSESPPHEVVVPAKRQRRDRMPATQTIFTQQTGDIAGATSHRRPRSVRFEGVDLPEPSPVVQEPTKGTSSRKRLWGSFNEQPSHCTATRPPHAAGVSRESMVVRSSGFPGLHRVLQTQHRHATQPAWPVPATDERREQHDHSIGAQHTPRPSHATRDTGETSRPNDAGPSSTSPATARHSRRTAPLQEDDDLWLHAFERPQQPYMQPANTHANTTATAVPHPMLSRDRELNNSTTSVRHREFPVPWGQPSYPSPFVGGYRENVSSYRRRLPQRAETSNPPAQRSMDDDDATGLSDAEIARRLQHEEAKRAAQEAVRQAEEEESERLMARLNAYEALEEAANALEEATRSRGDRLAPNSSRAAAADNGNNNSYPRVPYASRRSRSTRSTAAPAPNARMPWHTMAALEPLFPFSPYSLFMEDHFTEPAQFTAGGGLDAAGLDVPPMGLEDDDDDGDDLSSGLRQMMRRLGGLDTADLSGPARNGPGMPTSSSFPSAPWSSLPSSRWGPLTSQARETRGSPPPRGRFGSSGRFFHGTSGTYQDLIAGMMRGPLPPHLLFSDRDFTADDYEMLCRLDDTVENRKGASQTEIDALPTVVVSKAGAALQSPPVVTVDLTQSQDETAVPSSSPAVTAKAASTTALIASCSDRCTICLEDVDEGAVMRQLPCTHLFHKDCVDIWLKQKASCPICQRATR